MFARVIVEPDQSRAPVYDSVTRQGRFQSFCCAGCGRSVSIDFNRYIGQDCDPETVLGNEHADEVAQHFGIPGLSLRNGWPRVRIETCAGCGVRYLVCVAEFEPRMSWCQGVLHGVTELAPSS